MPTFAMQSKNKQTKNGGKNEKNLEMETNNYFHDRL